MSHLVVNLQTGEQTTVPPTAEEIAEREAYARDVAPVEQRQLSERNRAAAYRLESDPLFFKSQRGEATTEEWTAKVAEIKERFPYPGGEE